MAYNAVTDVNSAMANTSAVLVHYEITLLQVAYPLAMLFYHALEPFR
jgi:hypothetical protein